MSRQPVNFVTNLERYRFAQAMESASISQSWKCIKCKLGEGYDAESSCKKGTACQTIRMNV